MTAAFVEPAYGHRGLGDVVPAIGRALGSDVLAAPTGLVLPDAPAYVLFLVDGLGSRLLDRYAATAPYLSSLLADSAPGTAGVPSTTATSLTSLGTGLTPGTHGLVGFTSRVPGHGPAAQRAVLGQVGGPAGVAAAPDRLLPAHR